MSRDKPTSPDAPATPEVSIPDTPPKVSCLVVTADRGELLRRSVRCYLNQSWPHKELVVVDDGEEDLEEVLRPVPPGELRYVKLERRDDATLGELRNRSLEEASGDYLVQWDDDDWFHPDRIAMQAQVLEEGCDACCLSGALMHLDEEPYRGHPYVGFLPEGIPGSIMHRSGFDIRYPHARRAEDTDYLRRWRQERYRQLPDGCSHLLIRCYHGSNTWEREHFLRRLRNSPWRFIRYYWYAGVRGRLFDLPEFRLSDRQRDSYRLFLQDSQTVGLM